MSDKHLRNIKEEDWLIINQFRKKQKMTWGELFHFIANTISDNYDLLTFRTKLKEVIPIGTTSTATISSDYEFLSLDDMDIRVPCLECGKELSKDGICLNPKCKEYKKRRGLVGRI